MKTGIIGLPQVGKTSLFRILTKAHLSEQAYANPREAHIGVAKVPDDRLDRLAALYNPKKLTHASVEYVDVGAIGQEALKETAYLGHLRNVDALAHVVRAFDDPSIPHVGRHRSAARHQERRVRPHGQRPRADRKTAGAPGKRSEENAHCRIWKKNLICSSGPTLIWRSERPLREMEMTPEDKKRLRGFMFLSEKPILYVLNSARARNSGTIWKRRSANTS